MATISTPSKTCDEVERWAERFHTMWNQATESFRRQDTRARVGQYVRGLLGRVERKNGWQLAEYAGENTPYAMQHVLDRADWDADGVRDELRRYAFAHLLAPGEGGALVVDETGFLKKGDKSAGVQRQYSGTAGRIENCQVGVFLALAGSRGRALVDRALYLPRGWCDDEPRCRVAKIPAGTRFATKPQLAQSMLARALEGGLTPAWVLADEVYGGDGKFRDFLERRGQPYVVAVSVRQHVFVSLREKRADTLAKELAPEAWARLSVGEGSKGPRVYDWAAVPQGLPRVDGLCRWVLFRRNVERPEEQAYYLCLAPKDTTLRTLAEAAGRRWSIECCFEAAKQETGLDEYEVRSWHGWHRHITLSMLALVFLAAVRAEAAEVEMAAPTKKRIRRWCP